MEDLEDKYEKVRLLKFRNNGTAVLLEQIPTDTDLVFRGTHFTGNGADIDNRCGQELDILETVFE